MELNLEAMLKEAQIQAGGLLARCIVLAGENEVLKQKLAAIESGKNQQNQE